MGCVILPRRTCSQERGRTDIPDYTYPPSTTIWRIVLLDAGPGLDVAGIASAKASYIPGNHVFNVLVDPIILT
jgi:hypothetical protein